jgi:hypothetical protein
MNEALTLSDAEGELTLSTMMGMFADGAGDGLDLKHLSPRRGGGISLALLFAESWTPRFPGLPRAIAGERKHLNWLLQTYAGPPNAAQISRSGMLLLTGERDAAIIEDAVASQGHKQTFDPVSSIGPLLQSKTRCYSTCHRWLGPQHEALFFFATCKAGSFSSTERFSLAPAESRSQAFNRMPSRLSALGSKLNQSIEFVWR